MRFGSTAKTVADTSTVKVPQKTCGVWAPAGALKTLGSSRDAPLPVKLFEVSDVVLTAPLEMSQVGAINRRRLVALTCDRTSGFEVIHGLLNRIMETLGVTILDESKPP